jgi:iron complex transport system substrate-binding protein
MPKITTNPLSTRWRRWRRILIVVLACWVMVAWHPFNPVSAGSTQVSDVPPVTCRNVQHKLGTVCIPAHPQRIVSLDAPAILDSLLALGIQPVGTVVDSFGNSITWSGKRYFVSKLPELVANIPTVGAEGRPALEKIIRLHPDLILLDGYDSQLYPLLSQIAPTVVLDIYNASKSIPEVLRQVADFVGRSEQAESVLQAYRQRIQSWQQRHPPQPRDQGIAVVSFFSAQFWVPPRRDPFSQVFQDLGIPLKVTSLQQDKWQNFSAERLDAFESDKLFIINDGRSSKSLPQHPLIPHLNVYQRGQLHIVRSQNWEFYGPIGMNLFLDELEQYFD